MSALMPLGPDPLIHNLRILAARLGWPEDAAKVCEAIATDYPGWVAHWQPGRPGRPPGFYALHPRHYHMEPHLYGADETELRAAIDGHQNCPAADPVTWPLYNL